MKIKIPLVLICAHLFFLPAYNQTVQSVINVPAGVSQNYQALLYKPKDYGKELSEKYPLLIFLHGSGESVAPLLRIYNNTTAGGPAYFIEHGGWPASFTNPANGKKYKFLVVSPQATGNGWSTTGGQLNNIIQYLVANYRVDTNRIYLTGLSAGGDGIVRYAGHMADDNGVITIPKYKAAAMAPMSEANGSPKQVMINQVVADSIRVWGFGSVPADDHGYHTQQMVIKMNNKKSGIGRFTNYQGGHCCWNNYYNPNYREIINGVQMNIYEWMLQFTRADIVISASAAK